MRPHLIVEGDDLVAVVRPEQHQVARVRLPHQCLDRADRERIPPVRIERVRALEHLHDAVGDTRPASAALNVHPLRVERRDQADPRMLPQRIVQHGVRRAPGDVLER